jgi:hypothetical protein
VVDQLPHLRLSAFDMRTTPELVAKVSRDVGRRRPGRAHRDDVITGANRNPAEQCSAWARCTLSPGMPVEAFIQTASAASVLT